MFGEISDRLREGEDGDEAAGQDQLTHQDTVHLPNEPASDLKINLKLILKTTFVIFLALFTYVINVITKLRRLIDSFEIIEFSYENCFFIFLT